jgi:hypothetical protein
VSTPQPKVIVEPPYYRTTIPDGYAARKTIKGGHQAPITICRATWRYPQLVTIYSSHQGIIDTALSSSGNVYTWGQVRLKITYGDGNVTFRRDVPAGAPITLIGSIVEVAAYICLWNLGQSAAVAGDSANFPLTVQANVGVAVLEGRESIPRSRIQSNEYNETGVVLPFGSEGGVGSESPYFRVAAAGEGKQGPLLLYALTGFQESGSDLYVQLFDSCGFAANYPNPDLTLQNGNSPAYEFKAFDGENFSLNLEEGMVFQHGIAPCFSSTPGILTKVDPLSITYRANWTWGFASAPTTIFN